MGRSPDRRRRKTDTTRGSKKKKYESSSSDSYSSSDDEQKYSRGRKNKNKEEGRGYDRERGDRRDYRDQDPKGAGKGDKGSRFSEATRRVAESDITATAGDHNAITRGIADFVKDNDYENVMSSIECTVINHRHSKTLEILFSEGPDHYGPSILSRMAEISCIDGSETGRNGFEMTVGGPGIHVRINDKIINFFSDNLHKILNTVGRIADAANVISLDTIEKVLASSLLHIKLGRSGIYDLFICSGCLRTDIGLWMLETDPRNTPGLGVGVKGMPRSCKMWYYRKNELLIRKDRGLNGIQNNATAHITVIPLLCHAASADQTITNMRRAVTAIQAAYAAENMNVSRKILLGWLSSICNRFVEEPPAFDKRNCLVARQWQTTGNGMGAAAYYA